MPVIENKLTAEKKWGLYVNGIIIGDSKQRFDTDFSVVALKTALGIREHKNGQEEAVIQSNNVQTA